MAHHKRGKPKNARKRNKPSDLRRMIGAEIDTNDAFPTIHTLEHEKREYIEARYGGPELYEDDIINWYLSFSEGDK